MKTAHPIPHPFVFGIYPGGQAGTDTGITIGKPDESEKVNLALAQLQPANVLFIVRAYVHYRGPGSSEVGDVSPNHPAQYCTSGRKLDLVLCYRSATYQPDHWAEFIRNSILAYGEQLACIQIAEEPNLYVFPGDGAFPEVSQAIIHGVKAAKAVIQRSGLSVQVGFNAVPCFNPEDRFWNTIKPLIDESFINALDYVGFDFFPDVFRRLTPPGSTADLQKAIEAVLRHFREVNLGSAGIPDRIPIHITENGWPTAPDRSEKQQAETLETVIRTIMAHRQTFHITQYEHFDLRDADSSNPDFFYQFGLLRDDYTPKPAFEVYQRLIQEMHSVHLH